jgi:SEC-C motif
MGNKIGRNQPCPCGSGVKYKRCHGRLDDSAASVAPFLGAEARHSAAERIRETQQGLGRPIIAFKTDDHQIVAVHNTVYFSKKWKTFPDFLADYIKHKLDPAWGNAELAKPFTKRHPIIQWYDTYTRYQHEIIQNPGEVYSGTVTGIVACYLGLAYGLYLLDHNVELQTRFIRRLKDPANFQGAYYELMVASILIRAGFTLTLEDETDVASKHCEFAAVSQRTGKKYWVEAKMRSIAGLLGKTEKDGGTDGNSIARLVSHLNGALAKPAADERLIFIDLNADPEFQQGQKLAWLGPAMKRLEQYEATDLPAGVTAYVFVTNMSFHRRLSESPIIAAAPFGLGIPDFNKPGMMRLTEAYRRKQKHIDAYHIGDAFAQYTNFPSTFDGRLPSEAFGANTSRVTIGETYHFPDVGEEGLIGTVSSATVNEKESQAYIAVTDPQGKSHILRQPMSEQELTDYKSHPDAYFGKIMHVSKRLEGSYDMFEWFMDVNKDLSRATLLEHLSKSPHFEALKGMTDSELLAEYCEGMVAGYERSRFKPDATSKAL